MAELGSVSRKGLIAGNYPTKTEEIIVTGPVEFQRGDVIGVTDDGVYGLVDSSKTDGSQNPIGIICDNIIVEDGNMSKTVIYVKGEFAHRFLRYGGSDTTETHKRRMTEIGLLVKETKVEGGAYTWQ